MIAGTSQAAATSREAHRVAREAEDRYIEVSGLPTLREETRRTRRVLLLSAVITIGMVAFGLRPTRIAALGLSITGLKSLGLLIGAVAFTIYFWFEFLAFASRDFRSWSQPVRVAYRELVTALDREAAQTRETYQGYGRMQLLLDDCAKRKALYPESVLGKRESPWAPIIGVGRVGWIEYALPHLIAIVAIVLGTWKLAEEVYRAFSGGGGT